MLIRVWGQWSVLVWGKWSISTIFVVFAMDTKWCLLIIIKLETYPVVEIHQFMYSHIYIIYVSVSVSVYLPSNGKRIIQEIQSRWKDNQGKSKARKIIGHLNTDSCNYNLYINTQYSTQNNNKNNNNMKATITLV